MARVWLAAVAATVAVILAACAAAAAGAAVGAKGGEWGPPCDKASKLYKANKLYDVLGVKKTAKPKEIRRGFKKMSIKCKDECDKSLAHFVCCPGPCRQAVRISINSCLLTLPS